MSEPGSVASELDAAVRELDSGIGRLLEESNVPVDLRRVDLQLVPAPRLMLLFDTPMWKLSDMTMEKRGVIEPGRTPPEDDSQKQASADQLQEHVSKRASDTVNKTLGETKDGSISQQPK